MEKSYPKMNRRQAKVFWSNLSSEQKKEFNKLMAKLYGKKLIMTNVLVDDNEKIQRIILEDKDKPNAPSAPFGKHFNLKG